MATKTWNDIATWTRRSGHAAGITAFVALALVGSGWLAYASTSSNSGVYPVKAVKVRGRGAVLPCVHDGRGSPAKNDCSRFDFSVVRPTEGARSSGAYFTLVCKGSDPGVTFHHDRFKTLNVSGDTATFAVSGVINGKKHDGERATADVTVTNNPDSFNGRISTKHGFTCEAGGPLLSGSITIGKLNGD